jgi:hypothetical protein
MILFLLNKKHWIFIENKEKVEAALLGGATAVEEIQSRETTTKLPLNLLPSVQKPLQQLDL